MIQFFIFMTYRSWVRLRTVYFPLFTSYDSFIMSQVEDRILSAIYMIWLIHYESIRRPYTFRRGPYTFTKNRILFEIDRILFEKDRILFVKDRIDFAKDRIDFVKDRIVYAGTVYFQAKTVYFQLGPYTFQDRILSKTVYFTFQVRILYNLIN